MNRRLKRVALEGLGWLLVVAGLAAIVLPGPGLLMLFAGLAILSQEYEWAERRVEPVKRRALRGAAESVDGPVRILLSGAFGLAIVALGILWIWQPAVPGWWPLAESWWLLGGPATGITLVLSGIAALVLIGYSYRRFRVHGEPVPD